eukprot:UN26465
MIFLTDLTSKSPSKGKRKSNEDKKPETQNENKPQTQNTGEQIITPYTVQAGTTTDGNTAKIDYNKIVEQFGCDKMTDALLERFEKLTGQKPHPLIRRGVYYAHRDLNLILDCYEKGEPFYLYTGRGPSSASMHIGHMTPFIINKYLQDVFDCPLVIQITDDEKFFFKGDKLTLEKSHKLGRDNAKDIIAFGFDITKTFIFSDMNYIQYLYPNTCKVQKKVSLNLVKKILVSQKKLSLIVE